MDLVAAAAGVGLFAAAALTGALLGLAGRPVRAPAAPLFAHWQPHVGPGTPVALGIAAMVCWYGPGLAARLRWRWLLAAAYPAALCWSFSLAMVDGWQRGLAGRLDTDHEYLSEVAGAGGVRALLGGFAGRILDGQPDSWTTHVAGHPPGALLVFVGLDRIGLSGGGWAAVACAAAGASVAVTVPMTLRLLGGAGLARAAVPFLVLFPGAVWAGASADGIFAGVTAAGVAALAAAVRWDSGAGRDVRAGWGLRARRDVRAGLGPRAWRGRRAGLGPRAWRGRRAGPVLAVVAGLLFGAGCLLSYGLVLMAPVAVAVLVVAARAARTGAPPAVQPGGAGSGRLRSGLRALLGSAVLGSAALAALGAAAVVAAFAAAGFWWLDGYHLVVQRYYQGIAADRPYGYWVWANLACLVACAGPAAVPALRRAVAAGPASPMLVPVGAAVAIGLATLSGLSKAEVERIWLPFAVWLVAAAATLPAPGRRGWLAAQAGTALLVNHLVFTAW